MHYDSTAVDAFNQDFAARAAAFQAELDSALAVNERLAERTQALADEISRLSRIPSYDTNQYRPD